MNHVTRHVRGQLTPILRPRQKHHDEPKSKDSKARKVAQHEHEK